MACLTDLAVAREIGNAQAVSMFSDVLLGTAEIASVSVLWLAFFPPTFYTDWKKYCYPLTVTDHLVGEPVRDKLLTGRGGLALDQVEHLGARSRLRRI